VNVGFIIKAPNDPINMQQEEHQYYMQRLQNSFEEIVEEVINMAKVIQ
jgi:hypothetical protein